ncbi:uncharacterized protein N7518_002728 [Penicillium psychrosexuale]|uniref:uncharacterized protein n=1 Tax=Penicillium psychrosexuale TaxID=1002107 RepID=UPI0025450DF5|nr:uncharacterized protein N7518_002728 [Penicillium psychrosexuale]KAJ5800660.1 hypothetical protein N7518_002728 [Penicillium psychrosexuale]
MADHTSFAMFTGHQLSRGFFEAPGVDTAVNPHPAWGYFHGPVIDPNPNWKPAAWHTAQAAGNPRYNITAGDIDNVNDQPPNPRLTLSKMNLLVCPVVEIVPAHQCGMTFETQPDFRRHLRMVHSGCFWNPDRKPISRLERNEGHLALVNYIRSGEWRNAYFMNEPGRGPAASIVGYWADCMSTVARNDDDWCNEFGLLYHRDQQPVAPTSGGRGRRRGQNPPPAPIPFMNLMQLNATDNLADPPSDNDEDNHDTDTDMDIDTDVSDSDEDDELSHLYQFCEWALIKSDVLLLLARKKMRMNRKRMNRWRLAVLMLLITVMMMRMEMVIL